MRCVGGLMRFRAHPGQLAARIMADEGRVAAGAPVDGRADGAWGVAAAWFNWGSRGIVLLERGPGLVIGPRRADMALSPAQKGIETHLKDLAAWAAGALKEKGPA